VTKPSLLYILHCFYNRAGVEEHVRALRQSLALDFEISLLFPDKNQILLLKSDNSVKKFPGALPVWPETPIEIPAINASIQAAINEVKPDLIHLQHFYNLPLSVLSQVTQSGVPSIISYHDYYPITPFYTMQGTANPRDCFSPNYALTYFQKDISKYLDARRDYLTKELPKFSVHIAPSSYLATTLAQVFPINCKVIEHGIKAFTALPKKESKALRIGYVGSLIPQKGWQPLVEAFKALNLPIESAELHLYGGIQPSPAANIFFHGVYEQDDLARICSEIDLAIIPSLFAETYSLVLSELWMGAVPVAVSDIGAFSQRVVDAVNGKKFKAGDVAAIQETIRWFISNSVWRSWKLPKVRTISDMARDYGSLYRTLIK